MKLYYKAVSEDGKTYRGFLDAKDIREAAIFIRQRDLIPITIEEESKTNLLVLFRRKSQFGARDLSFFTRQLSSMLGAGLTLMQSLNILKNEVQNPYKAEIIQKIIENIEEGKPFYIALSKHPKIFFDIYVMVVKAAEESGLLDQVLLRLAETLEKRERLKSTIRAALVYPAIVLLLMVVVIIIMMVFVVPQLTVFYSNFENLTLPFTTQVVIGVSNFMINFWPFLIGGLALGAFLFKKWYATQNGKLLTDRFMLMVPLIGKLLRESILADFSRTFGLMVGTGSLVVDSLQKSADTISNRLYKTAILAVSQKVVKGVTIGNAMASTSLFPSVLVEMVKIGEQTGKLDDSLIRVSEYYEHEVDQSIKILMTALEPVVIIVLAVGVGFLLFAILTPLYNILSALQ